MRILLINSVCGVGSTGRICTDLAQQFEAEGHEVRIAYGREDNVPEQFQKYGIRIGTNMDLKLHALRTRILDEHGFGSKKATKEFLEWAEAYNPNLLWLHNIHGYYINVEMLFDWIKSRPNMQVKWTLHDCWTFTGHCSYFTMAKCDKWMQGCEHCPQKRSYPTSYLCDNSKENFNRKKRAFTGVQRLEIVTPSKWLADLVKQSFLNEYPVEVRYNKINTDIFKPTPGDFRERYGLQDKKIVLGVASVWDKRKGLTDFLKLADMLDSNAVIVLVGLTEKQSRHLPENIIAIKRTNSPQELAQIYTAADVFVNPSREETFGLTTVEAIACGTTAIVYEETACEEIAKKWGGTTVPVGVIHLYNSIIQKIKSE